MRPIVSYNDLTSEGAPQNANMSANIPAATSHTLTPGSSTLPALGSSNMNGNVQRGPSPSKKRKRGGRGRNGAGGGGGGQRGQGYGNASQHLPTTAAQVKHWDEPDMQDGGLMYEEGEMEGHDAGDACYEEGEQEEQEESRELTHDEIWDDSALIAAWDAANEEYETMHGKNKRWKGERVHKSALWYNIPPEKSKTKSSHQSNGSGQELRKPTERPSNIATQGEHEEGEQDSRPINFETFVPSHDASLSFAVPPQPPPVPPQAMSYAHGQPTGTCAESTGPETRGPESAFTGVSVDEAFNRALGAMYWCGYWTAYYHVQRSAEIMRDQSSKHGNTDEPGPELDATAEETNDLEESGEDGLQEGVELVTTQR